MRRFASALCLVVMSAGSASAANWADDTTELGSDMAKSKAICRAAKSVRLPVPEAAAAPNPDCDSPALYYGTGRPADTAAARACALQHLAKQPDGSDDPFEGAGILANIYANGRGVKRDYDVAIAYACQMDGAPAEMDGRVLHLAELKEKGAGKEDFDLCQDITSGRMQTRCAELVADLADDKREAALDDLAKGWDAPRTAAFAKLRKALQTYVGMIGENEVDTSGTARGAMILAAQQKEKEAFFTLLQSALTGKLPASSVKAFKEADKLLNLTYGKVLRVKDPSVWGTVEKAGITKTQKAWIAYRDAFVALLRLAAPNVSAETISTELTTRRTKDLAEFLS